MTIGKLKLTTAWLKLTPQQRAFVVAIADGQTAKDATLSSYNVGLTGASRLKNDLLARRSVTTAISLLLEIPAHTAAELRALRQRLTETRG